MTRYGYNRQLTPPAPIVHVTLRRPDGVKEFGELPALLDTAADRTVIPGEVVTELALHQMDELPVLSFGGGLSRVPTYLLQLAIRSLPPLTLEVFAHSEEPVVLLGRDVLNRYRIVLDGPRLALEISPPP